MARALSKKSLDFLIRIVEFVLVLIIILDCNSVYRVCFEQDLEPKFYAMWIAILSVYILILLYLIKDKRNFECIKNLMTLFFISFVFTFEFVVLNDSPNPNTGFLGYFFFFMNGMVALFCIHRKNEEPFRLIYLMEYIILFLAICSLILWFGACVLKLWGKKLDVMVFWGGSYYNTNYLNLCFRRWIFRFARDAYRNLGIFAEGPMYGLFLGFGIYTELFLKKKSNLAIVVCFLLALLSSKAMLAILIVLVAFAFVFVELIKEKRYAKISISLISIAVLSIGIGAFLHKMNNNLGSLAIHVDDYVATIKCWIHYPILGCGFDYEIPIQSYMAAFRSDNVGFNNVGLSNSAGVVLAEGGIVLFVYYLLPFLIMMFALFKKNPKLAYWGAGMFMFWVVVIFHTRLYVFFLLAFGYAMLELKVRLLHVKENEKRVELGLANYKEYVTEENNAKTFWEKLKAMFRISIFDIPSGFLMVMSTILAVVSIYALINAKQFSASSIIACAIILVSEIVILVLYIMKKFKAKKWIIIAQLILWGIFMIIGHAYRVLDSFMAATSLRLQDSRWHFVVLTVILYAVGTAYAIFVKRESNDGIA